MERQLEIHDDTPFSPTSVKSPFGSKARSGPSAQAGKYKLDF